MRKGTIGIYDQIDKVTLKGHKHETVYLLTGNIDENFEVDLTSDCCFNEINVVLRNKVCDVFDVDSIKDFAKEHNLTLYGDETHPGYLIVGGEKDMVICPDLQFGWAENYQMDPKVKPLSEMIDLIPAWKKVLENHKGFVLPEDQRKAFNRETISSLIDQGFTDREVKTLADAISLYDTNLDTEYYYFYTYFEIAKHLGADIDHIKANGVDKHILSVYPEMVRPYEEVLNTIAEKMCDLSDIEASRKVLMESYLNDTSYDFLDQMEEFDLITDRERITIDDYIRVYERGTNYNEIDVDRMQEVLDMLGITKDYIQEHLNEEMER